ncbi:MAG: tRNA uridine-5-carboxymethylaminomethyl(34) synthesis GTPase MnmE [Deltaproteobacteria bacterium]|nr:tRNA uridine-5-carboxymethylaminomethyl(34) synthesis GTPase MnmE [Deltaproteobacteria bacterium]
MPLKNSLDDTIAAIATPPGFGGIGILRVSGEKAISIADTVWQSSQKLSKILPRQLVTGQIFSDTVLAVVMKAPHSYTGEDVVEFHCHGSPVLLQSILAVLFKEGARPAEPGEFTQRAFLNGKLDLTQAEAVADLIESETEKSAELAARQLSGALSLVVGKLRNDMSVLRAQIEAMIDFPEDEDVHGLYSEEIQGRLKDLKRRIRTLLSSYEEGRKFREGVRVVICGRPNVGKSSLLNALLQEDRAIVHVTPGTTRDLIEETINLRGLPVRLVDTAGIHGTGGEGRAPSRAERVSTAGRNPRQDPSIVNDPVESEGIRRSWQQVRSADLILFLVDASVPFGSEDVALYEKIADKKPLVIFNKKDLSPSPVPPPLTPVLSISAKNHEGIEELKGLLYGRLIGSPSMTSSEILLTNSRHKDCLQKALVGLERVEEAVQARMSLEFLAADLLIATNHLSEITGEITNDEILGEIFARFCIGK